VLSFRDPLCLVRSQMNQDLPVPNAWKGNCESIHSSLRLAHIFQQCPIVVDGLLRSDNIRVVTRNYCNIRFILTDIRNLYCNDL
jgi:hypothetical protein